MVSRVMMELRVERELSMERSQGAFRLQRCDGIPGYIKACCHERRFSSQSSWRLTRRKISKEVLCRTFKDHELTTSKIPVDAKKARLPYLG